MKQYTSLLFICMTLILPSVASAQVARLVHYHGEIKSDSTRFAGVLNLHFSIYKSPLAEEPIWSETHNDVQITDGEYDVLLGSQNPLKLSFYEYFLEVKAEGMALNQSRKMIVGSGYNYRLWFLFAAYTIIWLTIFFYMLSISRRQKNVIKELEVIAQAEKTSE